MKAAEAAAVWIDRGYWVIPLPPREKEPHIKGWPDLRITRDMVSRYFNGTKQNIGVLLGDNYGSADVDLDCPEALLLASEFLPETGLIFGHKSKPASHWFYRSDPVVKTRKFQDPLWDEEDKRGTLVELRGRKSDGGVGLQTVVPPSVHRETGEPIQFEAGCNQHPANVEAHVLVDAVSRLAAVALLARYWPKQGARHDCFLAMAGALVRGGFAPDDIHAIHRGIYRVLWSKNPDFAKCASEVKTTIEKHHDDSPTTAFRTLCELINPVAARKAFDWLGIGRVADKEPPSAGPAADEWPEPIPLAAKSPDPIGADVLPGVLGGYSQALAKHTETPNDLSILAVLGAASAANAGKIEVSAEPGYFEPAHIWVCPLLESGNRKTAVIDAIRAPIDDYQDSERERLEPEFRRLLSERKNNLATIEKLRKKLKVESPDAIKEQSRHIADLEGELPDEPHRITLTTLDATPEALEELMQANGGRMAVISDEGGMFDIMSGRYSSQPNLDVFLKGHTGGRLSTNRRTRTVFVPHAYLTMCIVPQPGVIQGLKDKPFMRDRGLLARFLYAMPESPIGMRENSPASIPEGIHLDYRAAIARLLRWEPERPVRLGLTEPAYREWKEFQRHVERLMGEGQILDRLHDWGGKLAGAVLRIAGLLSAVGCRDLPPQRIQHAEIERATALCAALIPHAIAAFNLVDEDPRVTLAKRILRWLRKQEGPNASKRDCFRALHRQFDQVGDMDAPLQILIDHFYVKTGATKTGGRPSEVIEINPRWRRNADLA